MCSLPETSRGTLTPELLSDVGSHPGLASNWFTRHLHAAHCIAAPASHRPRPTPCDTWTMATRTTRDQAILTFVSTSGHSMDIRNENRQMTPLWLLKFRVHTRLVDLRRHRRSHWMSTPRILAFMSIAPKTRMRARRPPVQRSMHKASICHSDATTRSKRLAPMTESYLAAAVYGWCDPLRVEATNVASDPPTKDGWTVESLSREHRPQ
ncbi:MAG: hypothetical protein JWM76_2066 [Pseudonocardiales bacterium]|nr:hypothetical protein [Pseudonocardiales bacterium]